MTAYVTDARGVRLQLPVLLGWELDYTTGTPCDSFWLCCPWEETEETDLSSWSRFEGVEQGMTVFTGVVDECEVTWGVQGKLLEVSGRGMAALLLDNEALGQDYGTATLEDILRDHVYPFGIELAAPAKLPAVSRFSVTSGSSEWSVLYDFARYYGGVSPRFNREGRLVLGGWEEQEMLQIGPGTPVREWKLRERRYGVLSEIWVRDRTRQAVEQVKNQDFLEKGGCCRRVMTMPGRSDYRTMRYSGAFQLEQSATRLLRLEVTIPVLFYGKPGDLVELRGEKWPKNGRYRVAEARVSADGAGGQTVLELVPAECAL